MDPFHGIEKGIRNCDAYFKLVDFQLLIDIEENLFQLGNQVTLFRFFITTNFAKISDICIKPKVPVGIAKSRSSIPLPGILVVQWTHVNIME
jgi:hypothetical protein